MWKIKRRMQILLVTMHSIKQQNAHQEEGGEKKRQTRNRKEDQELRTVHINPLHFSVILYYFFPE